MLQKKTSFSSPRNSRWHLVNSERARENFMAKTNILENHWTSSEYIKAKEKYMAEINILGNYFTPS